MDKDCKEKEKQKYVGYKYKRRRIHPLRLTPVSNSSSSSSFSATDLKSELYVSEPEAEPKHLSKRRRLERQERAKTHDIRMLGLELVDTLKGKDENGKEIKTSKIIFSVRGTQLYSVSFTEREHWNCTCPDFAKRRKTCKHIYFVAIRALKMPMSIVETPDKKEQEKEQEKGETITPKLLYDRLLAQGWNANSIVRNALQSDKNSKDGLVVESYVSQRPWTDDEPCVICFEIMHPDKPDEQVYCFRTCGKSVHRNCFAEFGKFQQHSSCPYCRSNMEGEAPTKTT